MTNDPIEEWLSAREAAIKNDWFEPERISELVALVRVYREACLIHSDNDCPCNNCIAAITAEQKALEIVKK